MGGFYILSGLAVGLLVGLTGVGGGSLMTPLLVLAFGFRPATAVGTDLLYAAITKSGGAWVHGRRGTAQWRIAGLLAAGSLPAALLTISLLKSMALDSHRFDGLISGTLGVALILTALALMFRNRLRAAARWRAPISSARRDRWIVPVTILTGALLGVLVTVSSIGAGALGAVALFFLYPHLSAAEIVGTDLAHAAPLAAVAGMGHLYMGTVDTALLGSLLLGSLPGVWLGSHLGSLVPERVLRPILAGTLIVIGARLVW
jgi:uncharacterized membrane protein YfcA